MCIRDRFYWEQVLADMLDGEAKNRLAAEDPELLKRAAKESGVSPERWGEIEMDINRQPEHQVYEFENLEAVSYTHLDVYKRQVSQV